MYSKRWTTRIQDPGKFEGESVAVRFYYNLALNGGADDTVFDDLDQQYDIFLNVYRTGNRSKAQSPHLVIFENSDGFVTGTILTDQELEGLRN